MTQLYDHVAEATDFYNGNHITYPQVDARRRYDFLFRKVGADVWLYMNSFDDLELPELKAQCDTTVAGGGEWLIIAARTGLIERRS